MVSFGEYSWAQEGKPTLLARLRTAQPSALVPDSPIRARFTRKERHMGVMGGR